MILTPSPSKETLFSSRYSESENEAYEPLGGG